MLVYRCRRRWERDSEGVKRAGSGKGYPHPQPTSGSEGASEAPLAMSGRAIGQSEFSKISTCLHVFAPIPVWLHNFSWVWGHGPLPAPGSATVWVVSLVDHLRCCQLRWTVSVINWRRSSITSLSCWQSTSVYTLYSKVSVRHCVASICQWQRRLI